MRRGASLLECASRTMLAQLREGRAPSRSGFATGSLIGAYRTEKQLNRGLCSSIQYSSSSLFNTLPTPLFNSATRLYSIQRLVSIRFRNLPLFNRKEKRDSGYTHGFATASIDIGGNGGICEQSRLVNNHKAADESSTYFHVTTHACSCVGRMPLPLGLMRAET